MEAWIAVVSVTFVVADTRNSSAMVKPRPASAKAYLAGTHIHEAGGLVGEKL